jgi:hypothetical protein
VEVRPQYVDAAPEVSRAWLVQVEGTRHRVEISTSTRTFSVDGVSTAGGFVARNPRITTFDIGGHEASLTVTLRAPSMRSNLRRILPTNNLRRMPQVLLAYIFGGAGAGGGVAAGSMVDSVIWVRCTIYELRVDGSSRGSWIAIPTGDRVTVTWTFVKPDEPFPPACTPKL